MTRNSTLIVLLLALGIIGATLFWFLTADTNGAAVGPSSAQISERPAGEPSRSDPTGLPLLALDTEAQRAAIQSTELDLGTAIWIEGVVSYPPGTPSDERLLLFAASFAPDDAHLAEAYGEGAARNWREAECEVRADGSFRAPFARDAARGFLRVDGRYLWLDTPVEVDLGARSGRVEPNLGAWITGRFELPGGAKQTSARLNVTLEDWGANGIGQRLVRIADVGPELSFELRGVPAGFDYVLTADPEAFVPVIEPSLSPRRGEHIDRAWTLRCGASVAGQAVDGTGAPLADAEVRAQTLGLLYGRGLERTTTTGADGRFELGAIDPGEVLVSARLEGYLPTQAEPLELIEGRARTDIVLTLEGGNRVTGSVVWPGGEAAANAEVSAHAGVRASAATNWEEHLDASSTTDAKGRFSLSGLGEGPFVVRARATREGSFAGVREGVEPGAEVVVELAPTSVLAGRVVDDRDDPIQRFTTHLRHHREDGAGAMYYESRDTAFDRPDGTFRLEDLAPGHWEFSVDAEGYARSALLEVDLPREPRNVVVKLARAASAAGSVTDPSGAPIAGARVEILSVGGRRPVGVEPATTGSDGTFELTELLPLPTEIAANHADWGESMPTMLYLEPGSAVGPLQLQLQRGGRLTGEVYDSTGKPDAGRRIAVRNPASRSIESAQADGAGRFTVDGLAPGPRQVMTFPTTGSDDLSAGILVESVTILAGETAHVVLGAPPVAPVRVHGKVTQGDTAVVAVALNVVPEGVGVLSKMVSSATAADGRYEVTLEGPGPYMFVVGPAARGRRSTQFHLIIPAVSDYPLDLALPGGSISGRVTDPDGEPLARARVAYEDDAGESMFAIDGAAVATDDEGNYVLNNLKPGAYTVRASAERLADSALGVAIQTGVVVGDSTTAGVDLQLSRAGTILGTIRNIDGAPVPDVHVFVRAADGELLNPISSTRTDTKGMFEYAGCPPGSYTVSARKGALASGESEPVLVAQDNPTAVELLLEPGTMLLVTTRDAEANVVRARVSVLDESGREVASLRGASEMLLGEGFSSVERRIGPLAPGKYSVASTTPAGTATEAVNVHGEGERAVTLQIR